MKFTYDAIVVGAGVLGASVAAHLAEGGFKVLILERGEAVCGASGGNLGQISITDRWEPWHMQLAKRSLEYYETILSKTFEIEYRRSGGSIVLSGQAQLEAGADVIAKLKDLGIEACLYFGSEMKKAEPNLNISAADALLYCPAEGKLNPFTVTLAFLRKAQAAGAVLMLHTPVIAFHKENNRITGTVTPKGTFTSEWIINCTGPRASYLGELAQVPIPICYHKGTAFVSQPVPPVIRGPVCGGGFLLKGSVGEPPKRHIGFATVQTENGSILIAQATEVCESDDKSVNMPSLSLVAKRFLSYFPQLEQLQIVRAWAAVTTYTKDNLPVFGFSREASNLFTVAGFKGAFTVAPAVGAMTKSALEGNMDPDYLCCAPDRSIHMV